MPPSPHDSRAPIDLETAYYTGAFYWVVNWDDGTYSVVDGHGQPLSVAQLASSTAALENSVTGTLRASEEEQAELEARHAARVQIINRLIHGEAVYLAGNGSESAALDSLALEPFCVVADGQLTLLAAEDLDGPSVARFFQAIFENPVQVDQLVFASERLHDPYVRRLIDSMPEIQRGFGLDGDGRALLYSVAPLFPSLWVFLSKPYELVTTHWEQSGEEESPEIVASDTNSFWSEVIRIVKADYANPHLRQLLYDGLGVAELADRTELSVKTKEAPAGTLVAVIRDAVRQMDAREFGGDGTVFISIRVLLNQPEPWNQVHPEPIALQSDPEWEEDADL